MPFRYACFVSYRKATSPLAERFIVDLSEALSTAMEAAGMDSDVYLDWLRLEGDVSHELAIARAMCESLRSIIVFTPNYLSVNHPYCAREFKGLVDLEEKRLSILGERKNKVSLLVPIVLRGADFLPEQLKQRQYYDFSAFLPSHRGLAAHRPFLRMIDEIARETYRIQALFKNVGEDPCRDCDDFVLPSVDDVLPLLREAAPSSPPMFPRL
jgi:hypothetical protein